MKQYSVVLLDDEELILESLQTLIDWQSLRCYIAGTAQNGEEGRILIRRLRPDIVITDIKMPKGSGLDIAAFCAEHFSGTKVIILSAYADFTFAQSAMRAKTVDFLLKPLSKNELLDTVQKTVADLDQIERSRLHSEQEKAELENAKSMAASSLLFNLARYGTSGWSNTDWLHQKVQVNSVVVTAAFFNSTCPMDTALAMGQTCIDRMLREAGYDPVFGSADEKLILVCPLQSGIDLVTARNRLLAQLKRNLAVLPEQLGVSVFCVSKVCNSESSLQQRYREGIDMLQAGFFCTVSQVFAELRQPPKEPEQMPARDLVFHMKHGRAEDASRLLDDWKGRLGQLANQQFAMEKMRELAREAALCAAKLGMDCTQLWRHRYKNENFEERYECLRRGVLEVCGYARKKMSVVSRMCLYVEENYGDCGLSLELVASEMGLNSSYLSRAFKKEMNQKFSDYLVTVRIEQAQKLLRATQMKTYEIACEVGFCDAHYFSQVFKKKCGIAPAEYRAQNGKDRNFTT